MSVHPYVLQRTSIVGSDDFRRAGTTNLHRLCQQLLRVSAHRGGWTAPDSYRLVANDDSRRHAERHDLSC